MAADGTPNTKIDIQPLFATPVAITTLPENERISTTLRETILARAEAESSTAHSNLGGWQSTWDMEDWGGEAASYLLSFVRHMADTLTVDRHGKPSPQTWRTNAWANVNRSGHGNEFHTHPGCVWSAVYYVDDGGGALDPSLGGQFELQDPRGVAPAMFRPELVPNQPHARNRPDVPVLGLPCRATLFRRRHAYFRRDQSELGAGDATDSRDRSRRLGDRAGRRGATRRA